MYLNKVYLIGNLTRDPELKALPSGAKICEFSLATNRVWMDATTKEKKEATEYHNITVFGRSAENCGMYLKKGQNAMVEGRIETRSWDDKDTAKKMYRTQIIADSVQFGSKPTGASDSQSYGNNSHEGESMQASDAPMIDYPQDDINPEDIPF
jgi:single-strand DNA-binding protein